MFSNQSYLPSDACNPFCGNLANFIGIIDAFSMLTNSSLVVYDFLDNKIIHAVLGKSIASDIRSTSGQGLDYSRYFGKDRLEQMKKVCMCKNNFLKRFTGAEKKQIVILGNVHIVSKETVIDDFFVSFMGVSIGFTQNGALRYELFRTHLCGGKEESLKALNGATGERWQCASLSKRWIKMPALQFSKLEKQVISLSEIGLSAKEIAERVCRSEVTVKKAKSRIMQAVGASTMTEAAFMLSHYRFV